MKIIFTATGLDWDSKMDSRFGRTQYFLIYDEDKDELTSFDNTAIADVSHGAGPQTAQKMFELKPDILITGNGPGGNAARVLQNSNIIIYIGAGNMTVKEAFDAYKNGELKEL